jgi:hypothetical protein
MLAEGLVAIDLTSLRITGNKSIDKKNAPVGSGQIAVNEVRDHFGRSGLQIRMTV